jgi:dienelactone hydrolase
LRKYIWRQNENFEALGELEIVDRIEDSSYHKINDLESLQAWKSRMEFGFESVAYLFIPKQPNRNLIIYHSGHYEDGFHPALSSIQYWISAGFAVLAVALPLTGMNQGAGHLVDVSGQGPFFMKIHNHLQLLEAPTFSPLKIFMEPLRRFVNFAIQKNHFDQIFMAGLSGGGWATTLYAALDPRILRSYPVAGSLPLFLKSKGRLGELGDYEQTDAGFYGIANYLDLYIMGAVGSGRRQLQILNQYDPCCFPGLRAQVYVDELKKRLQKMGSGSFDLFVDSTHRDHKISARALELITKDMLQAD